MANKFCVSLGRRRLRDRQRRGGLRQGDPGVSERGGGAPRPEGYADDTREEGFAPLKELMENFAKAGGTMYVCSPCFKKRKLDENALVAGAAITGGAKLVEFLSDGSPCVSY